MTDAMNERLAGIRTHLREALKLANGEIRGTPSVNMQIVLDQLILAINKVAPNMPSSTIGWVAPMLREASFAASGEGDKNLALDLHYASYTLDRYWDG